VVGLLVWDVAAGPASHPGEGNHVQSFWRAFCAHDQDADL